MKSQELFHFKRIFDRLQTSGLAGGLNSVYTGCTVPTNGECRRRWPLRTRRDGQASPPAAPGASAHFRSTMASVARRPPPAVLVHLHPRAGLHDPGQHRRLITEGEKSALLLSKASVTPMSCSSSARSMGCYTSRGTDHRTQCRSSMLSAPPADPGGSAGPRAAAPDPAGPRSSQARKGRDAA